MHRRVATLAAMLFLASAVMPNPPARTSPIAGTKQINKGGLSVTLSVTRGERSRDSNSRTTSITLRGDAITYAAPHPPCVRGRCKRSKVAFELDQATYDAALKRVAEGALLEDMAENKSTKQSGTYTRVSLTVTLNGKTGRTSIRGMTRSRTSTTEELSERARARVKDVESLMWVFARVGRPRLPSK